MVSALCDLRISQLILVTGEELESSTKVKEKLANSLKNLNDNIHYNNLSLWDIIINNYNFIIVL